MKTGDNVVRTAYEDDETPIEFLPTRTYPVHSSNDSINGLYHQFPSSVKLVDREISQRTYVRYDALHYWFSEEAMDCETPVYSKNGEMAAQKLANNTYLPSMTHLKYGEVPDWKTVRDNTTWLVGPALGDLKEFVKAFTENLGESYIKIDVDDLHSRNQTSSWSVLYKLMEMDTKHHEIVEEQIVRNFNTRKALEFIRAAPDDEFSIDVMSGDHKVSMETHRKWFWESKWLYDYLLAHFPQFHTNFHTIVITNAFRRFQNDDFNINKLYRVLARLGRVNTKVVFIG